MFQIAIFFGGVIAIGTKVLIANNIIGLLSVIILIYIINIKQNSSFKLMWIILIVATPVIGVPFYIFTRLQPGTKHIAKRLEEEFQEQKTLLLPNRERLTDSEPIREMNTAYLSTYMKMGDFPYMTAVDWSISLWERISSMNLYGSCEVPGNLFSWNTSLLPKEKCGSRF